MSNGLNKVMLIGFLGKDPELRYTPNGVAVCNFSLATSESYKAEDGNRVDKTEWHNIVAWKKLAETCSNYLSKGSKVYLEGKLTTESYEKDGGEKRYITKIIISSLIFLDSKKEQERQPIIETPKSMADIVTDEAIEDDELPF